MEKKIKCLECGKIVKRNSSFQKFCSECSQSRRRKYKAKQERDRRKKNPERFREIQRQWIRKNRGAISVRKKESLKKNRGIVINQYGGRCICCGEDQTEFLAIDHKNNDGAAHRKEKSVISKGGAQWYVWIIKNNFPDYLQILCHNCNCAKAFYGKCPHR